MVGFIMATASPPSRTGKKELGKGLLKAMCSQLGIRPDEL